MNTYEQMDIRLQHLLDDKAELIAEFRKEKSPGVKQLIHEDIVATSDAIEKLTTKMETYATGEK